MCIRKNVAAIALSLILGPVVMPAQALAQQVTESPQAAQADKEKIPATIGFRLTQRPVQNPKEARTYAGEWITAGYLNDLTVGKIQPVGGLYIADLVAKDNPKQISNQLLIRKRDGLGILVYPGKPKQPAAEKMVGMAGLEGISGMSGMKSVETMPSTHGSFKVKSVRHARRIVDAWLLLNGLPSLEAGATRDLGGIYITEIVALDGKPKNQAVMRKSDAYIQMIHPVAPIGSKKAS